MSAGSADVVVIGAGHNSLITAAYLAAAGLQVTVLEDRPVIGGNTVTEELTRPGFQHDSCSSAHVLIQANPLLRDDELGLRRDGLRYVYADPAVVLPRTDGPAIVMYRDPAATAAEIAEWSPADATAYTALLAEWDGGLRAAHGRWNAGRLDPVASPADAAYEELRRRTAWDVIFERFAHQRTRDLLSWLSFATIQPLDRPGTGVLPFAITAGRSAFGWATPVGGSGALPQALARVVTRHGGAVIPGQRVVRVLVEGGRAAGVLTTGGERWLASRAVVSSAHLTQLPAMLGEPETPAELVAAAAAWRPGRPLFAVHLALAGNLRYRTAAGPVEAVAGGLGTAAGLRAQLRAFAAGRPDGDDPWVLVVCSTAADPDRAPGGQGIGKLLTFAPYRLAGAGWSTERERYAARLVARAARSIDGLAEADLLAVRAESPVDLEQRNLHNVGGSCHGGEFAFPDGAVLPGWPSHRLPIPGLYQTGATAHPGGSVSGRAGRNAARVVLSDLGLDPGAVMGPD